MQEQNPLSFRKPCRQKPKSARPAPPESHLPFSVQVSEWKCECGLRFREGSMPLDSWPLPVPFQPLTTIQPRPPNTPSFLHSLAQGQVLCSVGAPLQRCARPARCPLWGWWGPASLFLSRTQASSLATFLGPGFIPVPGAWRPWIVPVRQAGTPRAGGSSCPHPSPRSTKGEGWQTFLPPHWASRAGSPARLLWARTEASPAFHHRWQPPELRTGGARPGPHSAHSRVDCKDAGTPTHSVLCELRPLSFSLPTRPLPTQRLFSPHGLAFPSLLLVLSPTARGAPFPRSAPPGRLPIPPPRRQPSAPGSRRHLPRVGLASCRCLWPISA